MPDWIQLTKAIHVEERGKSILKQPGDWIIVGRQYAQQLVADGKAVSIFPDSLAIEEPEGSVGIMVFGGREAPQVGIETSHEGIWELRWEKTAFWSSDSPVKPVMFSMGFPLLKSFEIAVPLWDYRHLAKDEEMDDDEREYTEKIIRDLRVPLYDIRLMFVRRCESTRRLFDIWEAENQRTRISFLRSLYRTKPLILALPVTWTGQWSPTNA